MSSDADYFKDIVEKTLEQERRLEADTERAAAAWDPKVRAILEDFCTAVVLRPLHDRP